MSGLKGNSSVPSLPPPQPKSPPEYPDLYGKRRELAKVQMLEREISFLELRKNRNQSSSPYIMLMDNANLWFLLSVSFVLESSTKKIRRSRRFWKWLCGVSCFKVSWICCCCSCPSRPKTPRCCDCCSICNCCSDPCTNCRMPKCHCFSCWNSKCCKKTKCSINCCCSIPKCPSCPTCSCTSCTCYPKCLKFKNICSCCHKSCCYPCYFCY
ncbi:hypothetical protein DH2020_014651 [Rehmannia glutinosa]|uniref:Uncharacterized protein n=1 Tax=Rehmannia glutinosa TaxID=99300 RepID=A0ABR0WXI8_REHGL